MNWSLRQINQATEDLLEYGAVKGAWLTQIELDYLAIKTPPMDIIATQLQVEISIKSLLSGTLDIVSLQAQDLALNSKTTASDTKESKPDSPTEFVLPIGIDVHSLQVNKFSFEQQDEQLFILEKIIASDSRIKKQITIGAIAARSPFGELTASGSITPDTYGEIDLHTKFTLKPNEQMPEVKGYADFNGTLNDLSLHSELSQPSHILVNAKLESLIDTAKWQADINASEVSLQTFFEDIPLTLQNVKLKGAGNFFEYSVDGSATLSHKDFGDWDGVWTIDKTATQWNVKSLNFANPVTQTTIIANGVIHTEYTFTTATAVTLQSDWQNLQWPMQGAPLVASNNGMLSVDGSLNDFQLKTTGTAIWSEHEISNINITAQGNTEKLLFSNISADGFEGNIKGSGSLALGKEIAWSADTKLTAINLHSLHPELKTQLQSNVKIEGTLRQEKINSLFAFSGLKGTISGRPIEGKAQLSIDGQSLKLDRLALRSGKSRLHGKLDFTPGDATHSAYLNANWDVYLHDLKLLTTDLQGTVDSKGSMTGTIDKLVGNATMHATNLQFQQYSVKNVTFNSNIDLTEQTQSHIDLVMQQAKVLDIPVENFQVNIKGTGLAHSIDSKITQDTNNQVEFSARGTWKENTWNLIMNKTQLQTKPFGNWRQASPAEIKISAVDFSVVGYCLVNEKQGSLCSSVKAREFQNWDGDLTVEKIPFTVFKELLPPQFDSTDVDLSGRGTFAFAPDTGALLDFKASGENGVISGIKVENKETPIAFNHFDFALSNTNKKLAAKTSITIKDTGNIALELTFPNWSELSVPELSEKIQGHAKIDLSNLAVMSIISDYIKDPVGEWHSDIAISGTLEAPILIGESHIRASSLTLTTLGLKLRDVDLQAASNEKRAINISGSAKSGQGRINISGNFNDYRATESTGSIKITGEKFELARIPEATIIVSPDLVLSIAQNSIDLKGDIVMSEADFKIFAPTKTISPSPDVVIVSAQQPDSKQAPIRMTSKIRIILGNKVKVQGYGFSGRLEGSVLVDDTGALTTASGKINIVDGKYIAYGTELEISTGSLSFAGSSIDNPLINVRAERRPTKDIVAGVLIEGEVKSPKITLFSEPAMQDSDILSYIILGQPLNAASDQDGKLLTNAAASLGLLGGEKLAKEIGDKFGIDEIKIQTDHTTKDTSLLLGKYLSPDFYVGYAIGIGGAVDTLQIQYKLTEQWVLKTQSGEQQKAEILFTIEKD
ncbi:translocation/assembly module TamB domain-containing protein [Kaarinaea lacus]